MPKDKHSIFSFYEWYIEKKELEGQPNELQRLMNQYLLDCKRKESNAKIDSNTRT